MGGKQLGFSDYEQTKREKFLSEIEAVVPWQPLIGMFEPHYPKNGSKSGHPSYSLAMKLRIHRTQQWYSHSVLAMEDALIEVPTMRRFPVNDMLSDHLLALDGVQARRCPMR